MSASCTGRINLQALKIYEKICEVFVRHSLNAQCPYINYWPEDGSLERKHVASYVLMTICVLCLTE